MHVTGQTKLSYFLRNFTFGKIIDPIQGSFDTWINLHLAKQNFCTRDDQFCELPQKTKIETKLSSLV